MIIFNEHNLPDRILRLLPKPRKPKPDRMSITSLIDSPRIRTLQIERWEHIRADYADYLNTIIGLSVHERNERLAENDEEAEQKLEDSCDMNGNPFGIALVGKADNYVERLNLILDTKTKAVGFEKFGLKDLELQLNLYAWQRRMRFQPVERLVADIFLRDWKQIKTFDKDYPKLSYLELEVPLWSFEKQNEYVVSQLQYHSMNPYECPDEYRWKRETTYAVKTNGKKRADRVLETRAEAENWMKNNRGDFIEKRDGESLRCNRFCGVRSVCKYSEHCCPDFRGEK